MLTGGTTMAMTTNERGRERENERQGEREREKKGFIFFEPHTVCISARTHALSYARDDDNDNDDETANRVYIFPPPSHSLSLFVSNAWLNMN
jgi:hypothetical protein